MQISELIRIKKKLEQGENISKGRADLAERDIISGSVQSSGKLLVQDDLIKVLDHAVYLEKSELMGENISLPEITLFKAITSILDPEQKQKVEEKQAEVIDSAVSHIIKTYNNRGIISEHEEVGNMFEKTLIECAKDCKDNPMDVDVRRDFKTTLYAFDVLENLYSKGIIPPKGKSFEDMLEDLHEELLDLHAINYGSPRNSSSSFFGSPDESAQRRSSNSSVASTKNTSDEKSSSEIIQEKIDAISSFLQVKKDFVTQVDFVDKPRSNRNE